MTAKVMGFARRRWIVRLHCALQQAIACDYLSRNPADACKLPKVTKPEIKPLEPVEIARLLKEAEQDDYCNLFIVAMFTGMRQGELLGLAWECVDFKSGIITVKQQLQCKDGNYFLETPKSGKNRTILPAPIVMDALRNQLQRQQMEQERAGEMWDNQFNLVFADALGKYLVRRTWSSISKKFLKEPGFLMMPVSTICVTASLFPLCTPVMTSKPCRQI